MPDQEFLASFGVEIDEAGVTRLQTGLEQNRDLADAVAAAFSAATAAIQEYEKTAVSGEAPAGSPFNPEASARNLENGEYRSSGAAGILQEWISGSLTATPDASVRDYSLRSG